MAKDYKNAEKNLPLYFKETKVKLLYRQSENYLDQYDPTRQAPTVESSDDEDKDPLEGLSGLELSMKRHDLEREGEWPGCSKSAPKNKSQYRDRLK